MGRTVRVDHARVRALAADGLTDAAIAADVGCAPGYARLIRTGAVKRRSEGGSALSREQPKTLAGRAVNGMPPYDHPAIMNGHSLFAAAVHPVGAEPLLKSGNNSAKIGARITKGKWKGFPVYTLTLEERATCPTSCQHWRSCFGNHMYRARRFTHGEALETALVHEVGALAKKHPRGFAIRLHVLGDFYSVRYVKLWDIMLDQWPALHAFGFSARWDTNSDPIARELVQLVMRRWDRFAIRFSNAPIEECATRSVEHPYQIEKGVIWCPAQSGKSDCCSTCALCWNSKKNIAFVQH